MLEDESASIDDLGDDDGGVNLLVDERLLPTPAALPPRP
jgi:hypothetical protein